MKPIREYLQELPAPYNTLALSVVDESYEAYLAEVENLHQAIDCMCDWEQTPQEWTFWNNVFNWAINTNDHKLPPIPAVEVETPISEAIEKANQENQSKPFCGFEFSPEVEQETVQDPKPTSKQIASFIVDLIAKTEKLEQENTELRADKERIVDLLNKAQITIAELESQLSNLTSLPSQPKTPVYDAEWLAKIILGFYYPEYNYYFDGRVGIKTEPHGVNILLDPKASAGIIMAALAKELNEDTCVTDCYWFLEYYDGKYSIQEADESYSAFGAIRFCNKTVAQKAIGILTQIDPQILKNYFA
jgi:hypothetical protein